ncbi:arabinose-5-phosphate isomerase [Flexibacter flexilis DSM 6793]|uniref:Arabinose-5-phosphate isomerase n=1 Tax=Flexibacter flexilis DSM 6793 TaxID=927664 RepID=A0A1I1IKV7_9BACT|nr:KpsF/GutQ family sugar-phosphate isomerase [Flexibacter flexilis]SFC36866.1 arabinose-5-phosphate isomerase [Flexibacter flexilis DSM 6793]
MKLQINIHKIATNVLKKEAEAVLQLASLLQDSDFEACVEAILDCAGRVVITGIGKSAIIAQKIVATLNSTGTPALFMHAADAIHGDLGMIQANDFVIAISKSGNTPEIKMLVPLLKRTGVQMAALVGNKNSYLAQQSDFILDASVDSEACPLNLAPTTSTTTALALGDALAVCLLEARNFTSEDFARYHPGGTLGKRLYLRVADLFGQHDLPTVNPQATVSEIIMEITSKRLGATAVVDTDSKLLGIITDGDIRRMLNRHTDLSGIKATDLMNTTPKTIEADEYAVKALEQMQHYNITQLVVLRDGQLAGFVHLHDLLREGLV